MVRPGQEVHFELGRALVAQCAALISRVLYVKNGLKKNFLVLDAGMTELIRPMLYQAYHQIENLTQSEVGNQRSEAGGQWSEFEGHAALATHNSPPTTHKLTTHSTKL